MRRRALTAVAGIALPVLGLFATGWTAAGAAPTARRSPALCTVATISAFAFQPAKITAGQPAVLHYTIKNCSAQSAFSGSLQTFGMVCAVVDPLLTAVKVPPGGTTKSTQRYTATTCAGQGHITGELLYKGKLLSKRTAYISIVAPPG